MFYTYMWLRRDGTPYYIGKGKLRRCLSSDWHNVHRPKERERIILQEHLSEDDAFEAEKFFIAFYGRKDLGLGSLRNMTDGGDGPSGAIWSKEQRKQKSIFMKSGKGNTEGLKVRWYQPKKKTHCKHGHSLDDAPLILSSRGYMVKACRICRRAISQRHRIKKMGSVLTGFNSQVVPNRSLESDGSSLAGNQSGQQ